MPNFKEGDYIEHVNADSYNNTSGRYRVIALLPVDDKKGKNTVVSWKGDFHLVNSANYRKVEERFEAGKKYRLRGDLQNRTFEAVSTVDSKVIGWIWDRDGKLAGIWSPYQSVRIDFEEKGNC